MLWPSTREIRFYLNNEITDNFHVRGGRIVGYCDFYLGNYRKLRVVRSVRSSSLPDPCNWIVTVWALSCTWVQTPQKKSVRRYRGGLGVGILAICNTTQLSTWRHICVPPDNFGSTKQLVGSYQLYPTGFIVWLVFYPCSDGRQRCHPWTLNNVMTTVREDRRGDVDWVAEWSWICQIWRSIQPSFLVVKVSASFLFAGNGDGWCQVTVKPSARAELHSRKAAIAGFRDTDLTIWKLLRGDLSLYVNLALNLSFLRWICDRPTAWWSKRGLT